MNSFSVVKLSLATLVVSMVLVGNNFSLANDEFALYTDRNINWQQVNPFDTLEEMLVRELIDYGEPDKDFQLARNLINDKLAKVGRGEAQMSNRLNNERDAISAIQHLKSPIESDPCDRYYIGLSQMKSPSRPIVNRWLDSFGGAKIAQCHVKLDNMIKSVVEAQAQMTIIEKLPIDKLIQLIPEGSARVPEENWSSLMSLLTKANNNNNNNNNNAELAQQCEKFESKIINSKQVLALASDLHSVAPGEFDELIELPRIEVIKQHEILCSELKNRRS